MRLMPADEFAEWIAAWRIGLYEDEWLQAGTVAAAIQNEGYLARCTMSSTDPKEDRLTSPTDYIPGFEKPTVEKPRSDSPEAFRKRHGY